MKALIRYAPAATLVLLLLGCPLMPNPGNGASRESTDGGQAAPAAAKGAISVVSDAERGVAVYINENGERKDVVAEEYPGGPLVKCVEVADFTLVPASSDSDPLPVKAIVTGMRDDGTPGIWEIHSDDTILLPQAEQTSNNTARCIVGGDMGSLPDGIQMRFGWTFKTTAVSADGKIIVGTAENRKGVTIGGVQILAGSTVAVYWRVYSLPYSRFLIVSAPRIIGTFTKPPAPASWNLSSRHRSDILVHLKQYFSGRLDGYLVTATAVRTEGSGAYSVAGSDDDGLPSLARIDRNGGVAIEVTVPDLHAVSVQAVPDPKTTDSPWVPTAVLENLGNAPAAPVTLQYWIAGAAVAAPSAANAILIATVTIPSIAAGASYTDASVSAQTVKQLFGKPGAYFLYAVAAADPANQELNTSNNMASSTVTVADSVVVRSVDLSLGPSASLASPVASDGSWSVTLTVTNTGADAAPATTLAYGVTSDADPAAGEKSLGSVDIEGLASTKSTTVTLSGKVAALGSGPGTYHVVAVVDPGNALKETTMSNNTADYAVPVIYDQVVIDSYDPSAQTGVVSVGFVYLDLFGPAGDTGAAGVPASYDLWTANPATGAPYDQDYALAWSNGVSSTNPDSTQRLSATIFASGLAPGDYWLRVRANNKFISGSYALRALAAPSTDHAGWTFATPAASDVSDFPVTGNAGAAPVSAAVLPLGGRINRFLAGASTDTGTGAYVQWIRLHLP
jgi:hypothetical protein